MRGYVPGSATPHPLGPALPALYQDDDFAQRMLDGLDEVLAPVFSTLDNFDAYLDPYLTPDDFLAWLAGWVGIALDESWDEARRRTIVARAVELYRLRGTAAGLAGQVEIQTGGTVEIVENGATGWSVDPGGELPGSPEPLVVVRVTVPRPEGDRHRSGSTRWSPPPSRRTSCTGSRSSRAAAKPRRDARTAASAPATRAARIVPVDRRDMRAALGDGDGIRRTEIVDVIVCGNCGTTTTRPRTRSAANCGQFLEWSASRRADRRRAAPDATDAAVDRPAAPSRRRSPRRAGAA